MILAAFLYAALANADVVGFRYNLQEGLMFEVSPVEHWSFSATYNTAADNATGPEASSEIKAILVGARVTYYFKDMGISGFYLAGSLGTIDLEAKKIYSTGAPPLEGQVTSSYGGGFGGYHWFWSPFNLNLGLGFVAWNFSDLEISNNLGTETYSGLPSSTAGIEFGLGISF